MRVLLTENSIHKEKQEERLLIRCVKTVGPYTANALLFMAVAYLSPFSSWNSMVNSTAGLDYSFIYIAMMGLLFGKKQSLIAVFLSAGLFLSGYVQKGGDLNAFFSQRMYLIHLASYLMIGFAAAYSHDTEARRRYSCELELQHLSQRCAELEKRCTDLTRINNGLQQQIIDSEDSFGKVYACVKKLASLDTENLFTAAIDVVSRIMKADCVAIYTLSGRGNYLRLKNKSGQLGFEVPRSIRLDDLIELQRLIDHKRLFVNRELKANLPMMAAPVVYEGRVVALVCLYSLPFEEVTMYHENLFRMTTGLITDALTKSYLYDQSRLSQKYLEHTRILQAEAFAQVLTEIRRRSEKNHLDNALLKIKLYTKDYRSVSAKISSVIRMEDFLGLGYDENIYILLPNCTFNEAEAVVQRLLHISITSVELVSELKV